MLEREHLVIMRALEREGTLTSAARKLGLTQSALSHTIKKLETELGGELWRREGRKLVRTEAGTYLLEAATRLLPQLEHAESNLVRLVRGESGTLRIGMECHPCYRWLIKIISPYLQAHPGVEVDVKREFQFGGVGALLHHDIDLLVSPDPVETRGLCFVPVFDYEHVLVVSRSHPLAGRPYVLPKDLASQTLLSYPVEIERLDVFSQFLLPAGTAPRRHRTLETTEIMLAMVEGERGVAALPRWLVEECQAQFAIVGVSLGKRGVYKKIHLGHRTQDRCPAYLLDFIELARATSPETTRA